MKLDIKGGGEVLISHMKMFHNSVKSVTLAKKSEQFVDLLEVYVNLSVYDSILTPFVTAELTVTDSNNMIADYPIIGGEIVQIVYNAPGGDDTTKVSLWMRVTGIKNVFIKERKQVFTIEMISVAGFKNLHTTVNKAFSGDGTSIIVDVFDNYLYDKSTGKNLNYDTSVGSLKFVSPRWRPHQVINWAVNKCLGRNRTASYFFFETPQEFFCLSTETLFDRTRNICITDKFEQSQSQRPEGKLRKGYHYKVPGIPITGADGKPTSGMLANESYKNVDDFRIDARQTYAEDINNGYIHAKSITHDLYHKKYSVEEFNYYTDYGKMQRLGKHMKYVPTDLQQNSDVKVFLHSKESQLHGNIRNTFPEDYGLNRRLVVKQMMDEVVSNFIVPGHPIISSGRLLDFNFPSIKSVTKPEDAYEKKYSGLYLVRDCIHIFIPVAPGKAQYKCDTNIVKDGFDALG